MRYFSPRTLFVYLLLYSVFIIAMGITPHSVDSFGKIQLHQIYSLIGSMLILVWIIVWILHIKPSGVWDILGILLAWSSIIFLPITILIFLFQIQKYFALINHITMQLTLNEKAMAFSFFLRSFELKESFNKILQAFSPGYCNRYASIISNMKKEYHIDGNNFSTLEEFYDEISTKLLSGYEWGRNLDAFNDILRGGFGTPENGFVFIWHNSELSKERLGHKETLRQLKLKRERCHSSHYEAVDLEIELAKQNKGSTVFDWLIEIIRIHGPDGDESEDEVDLILK